MTPAKEEAHSRRAVRLLLAFCQLSEITWTDVQRETFFRLMTKSKITVLHTSSR